ncbi:tetratricopeptide (TPR) repeat protein [Catenulispora sp. GP43]|uniref:tetratricopeptide repeat protein n=1 Tax=Catenulispora sp. GP43 TaxID=3156263 RepID=UPI0035122301
MDEGRPDPGKACDLAEFTRLLGELVTWAGAPSYRELARRTGPLLRPPQNLSKSTIADVFQSRRRRLNLDLVVAIVRALDVGEPEVGRWRRACVRVHAEAKSGGPSGVLRQLPADLATFTGRTAELDRLGAAVRNAPGSAPTVVISAIEGMGGVGKTQLAVHLAHRLVRAGRFPDAQLYVNLRGFDPEHPPADPAEVLAAFLRQLQVPGQQIPQTVDERAAMFRDRLHGRRAIVVLDNAADEQQVRDLIPSSPGCVVLITSRRSLAALPDAVVLHLDVLPVRDAVALLATIAGAERVRAEPEAAEQIVARCGALPLAVALAATRLRSRPTWSLADLAERLGTGLPALTVGATNVRRVLAMSFDGLPPSAQTVFRLLGLHPGPDYTVQAAAALAGIPISDARDALELLHDEHLLRQRSFGRYEMHDLLRRYVLELCESLDAPTRTQASDRLLDYYIHTACSAAMVQYPSRDPLVLPLDAPPDVVDEFADARAAQRWFDEEFTALRALITQAVTSRPVGAWQLAWSVVGSCINAGRPRELVEVQSVALSAAQTLGDLSAQGFSLRARGMAYKLLREFDTSAVDYERAIEIFHAIGDVEMAVRASIDVASTHSYRKDYAACLKLVREALSLIPANSLAKANLAQALNLIGWSLAHLGEPAAAIEPCTRAKILFDEAGDSWGQSGTLDSLAYAYSRVGQYDRAIATYREALALTELHDRPLLRAEVLYNLGDALRLTGDRQQALQVWEQSFAIFQSRKHVRAADVRSEIDRLG